MTFKCEHQRNYINQFDRFCAFNKPELAACDRVNNSFCVQPLEAHEVSVEGGTETMNAPQPIFLGKNCFSFNIQRSKDFVHKPQPETSVDRSLSFLDKLSKIVRRKG